jgi:SAM-dependent methyltransferase
MTRLALFEPYAMEISKRALGQLEPGQRLLDIACGPGTRMVQEYAKQGVGCVVVDTNPDVLKIHHLAEQARRTRAQTEDDQRQRVWPIQATMREPLLLQLAQHGIGEGWFDAVHIRAATAYLSPQQETQLFGDVYHLLKPTGRFVNVENVWSTVLERQRNPHMCGLAELSLSMRDIGFRSDHGRDVRGVIEDAWAPQATCQGEQFATGEMAWHIDEQSDRKWYRILCMLRHPIAVGAGRQSQSPDVPAHVRTRLADVSAQANVLFDGIDRDAQLPDGQRPPIGHPSFVAGIGQKGMIA